MNFQYNDGGRAAAGYKGRAGDCAVRAIAIAAEKPYQEVYDGLRDCNIEFAKGRSRHAKQIAKRGPSPRDGNPKETIRKYLESIGFVWGRYLRHRAG